MPDFYDYDDTHAARMVRRYDKGDAPVPDLPHRIHLHYLAVRAHPRWVVSTRASYICKTPRCKPVTVIETARVTGIRPETLREHPW